MLIMIVNKAAGPEPASSTFLVQANTVWLWPGIALTGQRGDAIVPVPCEDTLFWVTRLHGPRANDSRVLHYLDQAAERLTHGDEPGARRALAASGLVRLSSDGRVLMRAIAKKFQLDALDLPWADGPRLWSDADIERQGPFFEKFLPAAEGLAKGGAWDETKHPRWPTGSPEGGEFKGSGEGPLVEGRSAADKPKKPVKLPPITVTPKPPGIGHNAGPPLEEPPKIPAEPPLIAEQRTAFIRRAADWLNRAALRGAKGRVGEFIRALAAAAQAMAWLYDRLPNILSYPDEPKTLTELQQAFSNPRAGYQVHHIVEQTPARNEKFPESAIEGSDNLVLIPTLKHREITGWYGKSNQDFDWISPRDYLKGKRWDERRKIGLRALRQFKVLKR